MNLPGIFININLILIFIVAYYLQKASFRMELDLRNVGFKEEGKNILAKNLPKITYPLFNQFSFDKLMATKRSSQGRFFLALGS